VVRVPATSGREVAPTLVLQGHLDMVCERLPDSPNDAAEDRIALVRDGDWLTADGTTLGADDGIGAAAMLALAEDRSLPHGPLELLLTVNEEVGGPGEGASALEGSLITGRTLLNLDSEEDGKLTVGSAGSTDTTIRLGAPREPCAAGAVTLHVSVDGGLGGHSGVDIARGRANAIEVLARVLRETFAAAPFRLASLDGGKSWNAIPRGASTVCCVSPDDEAAFRAAVQSVGARVRDAYAKTDPQVAFEVAPARDAPDSWTQESTDRLLDLLAVVPSGPLAMSPDFAGLVETSTARSDSGARLARDCGDRRPRRRPRHGLVRPADRVSALARRAREHLDRRALLAAARWRRRRAVGSACLGHHFVSGAGSPSVGDAPAPRGRNDRGMTAASGLTTRADSEGDSR
jgi:dipeptidase D